ncbi:MAG: SUMF1/EgtB/PvdO family nonheme iron enzyme [Dissulfurispiraceae bacterium]|jgi:formylglycine-generating enzyme required for sulfatase activity
MMFTKALMRGFFVSAVLASAMAAQAADVFNMSYGQTSLQFVPVGDPGNAADTLTGYGAVGYTYQMGKYDVTVGQYCQFLNAVAKTDTYGLYYSGMATDYPTLGITQSGSSGNYSYSVTGGYSQGVNCPIFEVTWGEAARFCNWLQNGQPTGSQDLTTTEDGSYYLNGAMSNIDLMAVTRNANAIYVIPSEDEWYKAAYYKGGGTNAGYWLYPTKSNTAPINTLPDTGKHANFYDHYGTGNHSYTDPTNYLTPVGAFTLSPGPYGTYDQGGDLLQWNEASFSGPFGGYRGVSGSVWRGNSDLLKATSLGGDDPTLIDPDNGFRVAIVPEPGSLVMLSAIALSALLYYWRKHA